MPTHCLLPKEQTADLNHGTQTILYLSKARAKNNYIPALVFTTSALPHRLIHIHLIGCTCAQTGVETAWLSNPIDKLFAEEEYLLDRSFSQIASYIKCWSMGSIEPLTLRL